jgi:hypothetical protein
MRGLPTFCRLSSSSSMTAMRRLREWINAGAQHASAGQTAPSTTRGHGLVGPHEDGEIWSGVVWPCSKPWEETQQPGPATLVLEDTSSLIPSRAYDAASAVVTADEGALRRVDVDHSEFAAGLIAPATKTTSITRPGPPFHGFADTSDATGWDDLHELRRWVRPYRMVPLERAHRHDRKPGHVPERVRYSAGGHTNAGALTEGLQRRQRLATFNHLSLPATAASLITLWWLLWQLRGAALHYTPHRLNDNLDDATIARRSC